MGLGYRGWCSNMYFTMERDCFCFCFVEFPATLLSKGFHTYFFLFGRVFHLEFGGACELLPPTRIHMDGSMSFGAHLFFSVFFFCLFFISHDECTRTWFRLSSHREKRECFFRNFSSHSIKLCSIYLYIFPNIPVVKPKYIPLIGNQGIQKEQKDVLGLGERNTI